MCERQFILGVDCDGVLADFLGACAFLEMKRGGVNIWPALHDVDSSPEWLEEILIGYQYDRSLYLALNPIPYAASSLQSLAKSTEIVYITARPMFAKQDTLDWLVLHEFPQGKVVNVRSDSKVAAAKREKVDIFIEDRPCYANPLAEAGIPVILLDVYDRKLGMLHDEINVARSWQAAMRRLRWSAEAWERRG